MTLATTYGTRTIDELVLLYRNGRIELQPGFQRKSVWSLADRKRLIQSIVSGYPLPNLFLYKRTSDGKPVYDVIDGKQRLESIFMFMGEKPFYKKTFNVRLDIDLNKPTLWKWHSLRKQVPSICAAFQGFKLQTVEIEGNLAEIVDLFVRINATGKRLTSAEKRNARFFQSKFLKKARILANRYERYLLEQKILSRGQLDRMKGIELFSELLMSILQGHPINKKLALDRAIGNYSINGHTLKRVEKEFVQTLKLIQRMFPNLRETRLRNSVEFYTLFLVVWEMYKEGLVIGDRKRSQIAFELLKHLSHGVDEVFVSQREGKTVRPGPPYSDYLVTVRGTTDTAPQREARAKIIRSLLRPVFEIKDSKRIFSPEQRRILWNSDVHRKCTSCGRRLTWDDFTIDHVVAYAHGGRTQLNNAQLMCRSCNSRKGARS
ncbi:MAG: DUF262 domain-containing protein [Deltaproteobacteria bacterium]|nr:DUF262 domain-containing protein [Deltaproteobacteria bacterium]